MDYDDELRFEERAFDTDDRYAREQALELADDLPPYTYGTGIDGHRYRYNVIGRYANGTLQTSSWDAQHDDGCLCADPEAWY